MRKIAIIGAGITGVTTAYALVNRGFEVTVFDRNRYAAMETSFANGGQLSASNAEVWNQWSTVFKGIKWMFEPGAPLLVNPRPSWHKYSWMAEFVAHIPRYRANTVESVRLAIAAREHLVAHAVREGFDFDCEQRGIMHVYSSRAEFQRAAVVNAMLAEGGLEREVLGPDDICRIEPTLAGEFHGGYYTTSDFTGDIHRYTRGLSQACERRGAQFHYAVNVDQLRPIDQGRAGIGVSWQLDDGARLDGHFDAVVVCAGVDSRELASQLGDRVNIYPVKGYSITVRLDDERSQLDAPWVSLLDDASKIVTSRLGKERFRIAGTAEFNGYNRDIRDDRIRPLVKWCETHFPGVSTEHAIPWAGLRPMMPSMMPRVGRGRRAGVFYNTGHGHLGWTLSAATAEIVADTVLDSSRATAGAGRVAAPAH